jgi:hypothetical protein
MWGGPGGVPVSGGRGRGGPRGRPVSAVGPVSAVDCPLFPMIRIPPMTGMKNLILERLNGINLRSKRSIQTPLLPSPINL